jgi:hypothetical protein
MKTAQQIIEEAYKNKVLNETSTNFKPYTFLINMQ